MADLTPKTIGELPEATSLADANLFPVSASSASKKITWENIKKYFVTKGNTDNTTYISSSTNQPITIWQNENDVRRGLIVSNTYIGLYNSNDSTWVWRTPIFPTQAAYTAWPVSMGGTSADTADAARVNLGIDALISNTVIDNNGSGYTDRPTAVGAVWDGMEAGTVKVGRVKVGTVNYVFWAMKNSANYAVCTMTYYSGNQIYRYVKNNGNVTGYVYSGTAET